MSKSLGQGMKEYAEGQKLDFLILLFKSQLELLEEIRDELRQMNQANEPDPDAEPDPFQTLNGPRL